MTDVSTLRLHLMRLLFLLNLVLLGGDVWPAILTHTGAWDPVRGVALSFWAALSALSALGLRYPLKMVPLLLMPLFYKSVWLLAVALPTWPALRSSEILKAMAVGLVLDLVVVPWPYVFATYVRAPGERWR